MNIDSVKNWEILNWSNQVIELCAPIRKHFGVSYFNYVRLNQDDTRSLLTDRPDWIKVFYENKFYNERTTLDIEALRFKEYFSWKQLKDEFTFQEALKFNIASGVTLLEPFENHLDLYYFGTGKENHVIGNSYENNIDAFKRFILYFKDKGSGILKEAHNRPLTLDDHSNSKPIYNLPAFEHFINTIINSDYFRFAYISDGVSRLLSKQETICASYLILQFSMREIAVKLNISPRTVETYINNIKNKLFCQSKHNLVNKLLALKVININNMTINSSFYPYDLSSIIKLSSFIAETNFKRLYVDNSYHKLFYLTQKDCELLYYICNGLSAKGISDKIKCSVQTTEGYINNLKTRFFVKKKSDLVAFCVGSGLLYKIMISFPNVINSTIK